MAKSRSQKKASEVIAEECKGSIHREFPSEWLDQSLEAIAKAAKKGNATAHKAVKLLNDRRFKKA